MLRICEISYSFKDKIALNNIKFDIKKAEILSILGANGSGKSTLLRCIMGLLKYNGRVFLKEQDIKKYNTKEKAKLLAYVPQSSFMPYDFSVLEVVLMGRFHSSSFGFNYSKNDIEICINALEKLDLQDFKDRVFNRLSGGEKQLVMLARSLAQKSEIIILDEPLSALDIGNQMRILELLENLKNENITIIQTTHNPEHALRISSKVLWLEKGEMLCFGKPKEVITQERIEQIYSIKSQFLQHLGREFFLPLNFIKDEK